MNEKCYLMIIRIDKLVTNWAPYVEMGDRLCRVTGSIPTKNVDYNIR